MARRPLVTYKVTGILNVMNSMRGLANDSAMNDMDKDAAKIYERELKTEVPVRTGALKSTIRKRKAVKGYQVAAGGGPVTYVKPVMSHESKTVGQNFMQRAIVDTDEKRIKSYKDGMQKSIAKRGLLK
jgi:hypothetical protein